MKEFPFLVYTIENSDIAVNAISKDETIWLSQKGMAELFDVQIPAISKHLKNIFESGELEEQVVVSKMEITTQQGAMEKAHQEYDIFNRTQTIHSDFDEMVKKMLAKEVE